MSSIVTADLHFTDNPRDAYRWGLFPWLDKQSQKEKAEVLILGDITDAKDRHSAALVNRLVDNMTWLATGTDVVILAGNHDSIDPTNPFFRFFDSMQGIRFIREPSTLKLSIGRCLFIPAMKGLEAWVDANWKSVKSVDYIFTHQTYDGCLSENGTVLEGANPSIFKGVKGRVYSGDIHTPQRVGSNIEYVGAPYRVRFGDAFDPRVLLLGSGKPRDLHFLCQSKHLLSVRSMEELRSKAKHIPKGDQLKVRVRLRRAEYEIWTALRADIKSWAAHEGLELYGPELVALEEERKLVKPRIKDVGIDPRALVQAHAKAHRLDKYSLEVGYTVLKEVG